MRERLVKCRTFLKKLSMWETYYQSALYGKFSPGSHDNMYPAYNISR